MFHRPLLTSKMSAITFSFLITITGDVLGLAERKLHPETPVKIALDYRLPRNKVYLPTCLNAVTSIHPGQIAALDFQIIDDHPYYCFDIKGTDQSRWWIICDATTGTIVSDERVGNRGS